MSIDIDKGFKKVSNLRFFEIKKRDSQKKVLEPKPTKKRGRYKLPQENAATVERTKKLLISGVNCKNVAFEIGRNLSTIAHLIKKHTGLTMRQFQRQFSRRTE